nr:6077_t:CDS:2 [Entrophospora candida]
MVNYHLNVHVNLFLEQKPPVLYADYIIDLINFHRDAVKKLLNSGHKVDDYLSMNILKDMRNDPRCKDEFEGPGIIRIIDKLMCMNLIVLIYGSARCARNSSFTARIIDERINAHNNELNFW